MQRIIAKHTVKIDRALCIGAGSCVAVAPKAYALDSEAKAIFLDSCEEESWEAVMDGARSCPVAAIIIYDETGKQIFP